MKLLACLLALPFAAFAHGDLHEQIAAVTAQLARKPDDAELHLKRAELHRAHEEWLAAAKDYDRAAKLAPTLFAVELGRGKMLLDSGKPAAAVKALDRFIKNKADVADAYVTRARAKAKLSAHKDAAADFTQAIKLAARAEPELYIERAQALTAGKNHDAALRGLDEGIEKLGPLVTLVLPAIELEVRAKRHDAALARLDRMMAAAPRKETWLLRRAEILAQAGRPAEARAACEAALAAIDALPPRLRQTKATLTLREKVAQQEKALAP